MSTDVSAASLGPAGIVYASHPPPGVARDPNEPLSWQVFLLIGVSAFVVPLALAALVVRLSARKWSPRNLALDDYLMVLAMVFALVMMGDSMDMVRWGLGKHLWNVTLAPDFSPNFLSEQVVSCVFYIAASGLTKASILLFYLRIFPSERFARIVWALCAFVIVYTVAGVLVMVFGCSPVRAGWDVSIAGARCVNRPVFYLCQAFLGILTDIATVVAPVPMLQRLHMRKRQKAVVCVLLALGAGVCIISAIRLQSLFDLWFNSDLTSTTVLALMWCVLELHLSILGGCITAARPLVKRLHFRRPKTPDSRLYQQWHQLQFKRQLELRQRARELRLKRLSKWHGWPSSSSSALDSWDGSVGDLEDLKEEEELRRRLDEWIGPDGEERELAYELEFSVRGNLRRSSGSVRDGVG